MLNKDQAEEIKKEIWQAYNESDLDTDRADAIKLACSVIDEFIWPTSIFDTENDNALK